MSQRPRTHQRWVNAERLCFRTFRRVCKHDEEKELAQVSLALASRFSPPLRLLRVSVLFGPSLSAGSRRPVLVPVRLWLSPEGTSWAAGSSTSGRKAVSQLTSAVSGVLPPSDVKSVCVCAGKSSQWKGTVLDQVPVNPSLYLIKYDGFDCIYGLELYGDERVVGLEVLPDRVGEERMRFGRFPVGAMMSP